MTLASDLNIHVLIQIAKEAKVLDIMAEKEVRRVVVDYVPSRLSVAIARDEPWDEPLEVYPTQPVAVTYTLEDAMFAGVTYVSLVCGARVIINPFPFVNWDELAKHAEAFSKQR